MLVTKPGMKPCTIRVDQLDRDPLITDKQTRSRSTERQDNRRKTSKKRSPDDRRSGGGQKRRKIEVDGRAERSSTVDGRAERSSTVDGRAERSSTVDGRAERSSELPQASDDADPKGLQFPVIVHFGTRPSQLSYAGNYR